MSACTQSERTSGLKPRSSCSTGTTTLHQFWSRTQFPAIRLYRQTILSILSLPPSPVLAASSFHLFLDLPRAQLINGIDSNNRLVCLQLSILTYSSNFTCIKNVYYILSYRRIMTDDDADDDDVDVGSGGDAGSGGGDDKVLCTSLTG